MNRRSPRQAPLQRCARACITTEGRLERTKRSALLLSQRGVEAFEAGLGPKLAGIVVIPERRRSLRQIEPLRFRARVDVHVRFQRVRRVERADAHEAEIGSMSVIAPDRRLTPGTAIDVVRTVLARYRHGHRVAAEEFDRLSLDDRVEYERAARQPLAIVAMAAVDEHWLVEEPVADGSARAATGEFLWHGDLITQTPKHRKSRKLLEKNGSHLNSESVRDQAI
jgi:hypothetical protein